MVSNDDTLKAYDQAVDSYVNGSPQQVEGSLKAWINASFAHIPKTAKILEVGSGTGKDADYIESIGYRIDLSDASEGFLNLLTKRGYRPIRLNLITDDIPKGYDVIFANAVMLHFRIEEFSTIIKKVHDSLERGGLFLLTLKEGGGEESSSCKVGLARYFKYWQAEELRRSLQEAGFSNVNIEKAKESGTGHRYNWLRAAVKKD